MITDITDSGTVTLEGGNLFDLQVSAAPDTAGTFDVAFLFAPPSAGTELFDGTVTALDVTFTDGVITVFPEPGTGLLLLGAGLALCLRRRRLEQVTTRENIEYRTRNDECRRAEQNR